MLEYIHARDDAEQRAALAEQRANSLEAENTRLRGELEVAKSAADSWKYTAIATGEREHVLKVELAQAQARAALADVMAELVRHRPHWELGGDTCDDWLTRYDALSSPTTEPEALDG